MNIQRLLLKCDFSNMKAQKINVTSQRRRAQYKKTQVLEKKKKCSLTKTGYVTPSSVKLRKHEIRKTILGKLPMTATKCTVAQR